MGGGSWTTRAFADYTVSTKACSFDAFTTASDMSTQEIFKNHKLNPILSPYKIMRECRDSAEHPETLPVILALDVTGSMGGASVRVAQKLNDIMTTLYSDVDIKDVEFCIMGIGDLYCDRAPIQISQFESDVRIAEQLDAIYFEGGGGGNSYESYSAAWYMGLNHCDLDCWKRGKKGIIITMGDELPNPYLPAQGMHGGLEGATGDTVLENVDTKALYKEASEKFDIYHISVEDADTSYKYYKVNGDKMWKELLGDNYKIASLDTLAPTITTIIKNSNTTNTEAVSW